MSKTILGSMAVIFCGVLLIPLLVDTAPPSMSGAALRIASVIACLIAVWLGHIAAHSFNAMKWV